MRYGDPTCLQRAWLVMSLSGVRSSFLVDLASILTVCQDSSLKLSTSPLSVSLIRVIRRSVLDHVGLLDSRTMRDIWKKTLSDIGKEIGEGGSLLGWGHHFS